MGDEFTLGIYKYKCNTRNQLPNLPEQLKMSNISPCGVLLELVMGKMNILNSDGELVYKQETNFTKLPAEIQMTNTYVFLQVIL